MVGIEFLVTTFLTNLSKHESATIQSGPLCVQVPPVAKPATRTLKRTRRETQDVDLNSNQYEPGQ